MAHALRINGPPEGKISGRHGWLTYIVLQPPSLNVIVKAKLAVTCLGLEKVLKSDSRQIVEKLLL